MQPAFAGLFPCAPSTSRPARPGAPGARDGAACTLGAGRDAVRPAASCRPARTFHTRPQLQLQRPRPEQASTCWCSAGASAPAPPPSGRSKPARPVPPAEVTEAMRTARSEGVPERAIEEYDRAKLKGTRPDTGMCLEALAACADLGNMEFAYRVWDDVSVPTTALYNALMLCCARSACVAGAYEVMREMEELGVQADVGSFNVLLGAAFDAGQAQEAADTFEGLLEAGLLPDAETVAIVLDALSELQARSEGAAPEAARSLLASLREVPPAPRRCRR
eukprot:tig00021312_g20100.t1